MSRTGLLAVADQLERTRFGKTAAERQSGGVQAAKQTIVQELGHRLPVSAARGTTLRQGSVRPCVRVTVLHSTRKPSEGPSGEAVSAHALQCDGR